MSNELLASLAGAAFSAILAFVGWSVNRNVKTLDAKINEIRTDVRQLAAQGSRHGESLAAGVQQFKTVEKRLDRLEARVFDAPSPTGSFNLVPRGEPR
jgi:hypothetical protein